MIADGQTRVQNWKSLSVSIRLSHPAATRRAAVGLLLRAQRPRDFDRLLHGRRAGGQQQQLYCSVTRSGKCDECLVVS